MGWACLCYALRLPLVTTLWSSSLCDWRNVSFAAFPVGKVGHYDRSSLFYLTLTLMLELFSTIEVGVGECFTGRSWAGA